MERSALLQQLAGEAGRHELAFPTAVRLAMALQRQLDDPDCHVDQAARLVRAEPLLASRVVALANSAAYNPSGREITDVRNAVGRLGFAALRALAATVVARQLAMAGPPEHRALAEQLWVHTSHVAALARVIARRLTRVDAETAMFAGIVHEVGGFYLISRAAEFPALLADGFPEWRDGAEAVVGRAVLEVLGVPASVVAAVEVCWQGYLAMPPGTLGDTLLLADELAPVASPLGPPAGTGNAARIELVAGGQVLSEILAESAGEVQSLAAALRE